MTMSQSRTWQDGVENLKRTRLSQPSCRKNNEAVIHLRMKKIRKNWCSKVRNFVSQRINNSAKEIIVTESLIYLFISIFLLSIIELRSGYIIQLVTFKFDSYQMSEVTESILFRQKLYQNFKQSGLLSKLQTTVRTNLLELLQKPQSQQSQSQSDQKSKPLYLRDKFLACIVRQYLVKSKKQYTLSVLLPESNLDSQDCLNYYELSEITNFNVLQSEGISFLEALVNQWVRIKAVDARQRSTQTDFSEPVSKKLEDIDKQYRSKIDYWKLIPSSKKDSVGQTNLTLLAKEERMREQMQLQRKNMKRDLQLLTKAEMQKKFEQKYQFRSRELEKAHQGRLNQIKNREKTILESLHRKSKQIEQKVLETNQKQMKMIKKYENKIIQLQAEHRAKIKQLQAKQKQIWKKQLQIKAKKREYEDTIRLVKQKVIDQTLDV